MGRGGRAHQRRRHDGRFGDGEVSRLVPFGQALVMCEDRLTVLAEADDPLQVVGPDRLMVHLVQWVLVAEQPKPKAQDYFLHRVVLESPVRLAVITERKEEPNASE